MFSIKNRSFCLLWSWLPVTLVLLVILSLTLQSPSGTFHLSRWVQEVLLSLFGGGSAPRWVYDMRWLRSCAHLPLYFALAASLYCAWGATLEPVRWGMGKLWLPFLLAAALSSLFGLLDECFKIFLPPRHFDLCDLGLDVVGSVAGAAFALSTGQIWRALAARRQA